jgi:uncharacterized protein (TIGR02145 family)
MSNLKKAFQAFAVIAILLSTNSSCTKNDNDNNTDPLSTIVFNPSLTYGSTTDIEGNTYKTIKIGNQTWMAENLRVTKYNDGSDILRTLVDSALYNVTNGSYDSYNSTASNDTIRNMGMLYNWQAASSNKLAPAGWHVATQAEWDTLIANLGGISNAGGKLKETGLTHWISPNEGATNESGFSALPSGRFYTIGVNFTNYSNNAYFWSASPYNAGEGIMYSLNYLDAAIFKGHAQKNNGFAVRCVKN